MKGYKFMKNINNLKMANLFSVFTFHKLIFLFPVVMLVFSACQGPLADSSAATGTLTVNLGGGGRSAAWPPSDENEILGDLTLEITMEGPTGTQHHTLDKGATAASFTLVAGLWKITVEAYYIEMLFGAGSNSVDVKAGQNNPVTVKMNETDITFFAVANANDWKDAVTAITNGGSGKKYVVNVTGNFKANGTTSSTFGGAIGINVIICGKHTIELDGTGSFLYIDSNQTVVMRDLKLKGHEDNNVSLVSVNGGAFNMEGGASVSGNTSFISDRKGDGGGVYVVSGGIFTMSGNASVSDNIANVSGGGVYIESGGIFNMKDSASVSGNTGAYGGGAYVEGTFNMSNSAKVSGNTADANGGGVYIYTGGTFTMKDSAKVSDNTGEYGGGVNIYSNGTFNMSNSAKVSGNSAKYDGGGVCISGTFNMYDSASVSGNTAIRGGGVFNDGTFNISGGTVYGSTDPNTSLRNKLTGSGSGAALATKDPVTIPGTATQIVTNDDTIRVVNRVLQP